MDIYILRDGAETGPFSEEATQQMLKQGMVGITDLAWKPGMPQWIPLHSVLYPARADASPSVTPASLPAESGPKGEPATPKQKAFLHYMGIAFPPEIGKEQAAILVNDAMENSANSARITRWNDERLALHPELFAVELHDKKEARIQRFFELCQTEGAEAFEGVTKAHCQVLVGYLDVKFPNWDARGHEAVWNYFFPAIAEKFPQLVNPGWKEKLHYPQLPKVAAELHQKHMPGTAKSSARKKSSPLASLAKGLMFGLVIVGLGLGGLYLYKHPATAQELLDQAKAQIPTSWKSGDQKPNPTSPAGPAKPPVIASGEPRVGSNTSPATTSTAPPASTGTPSKPASSSESAGPMTGSPMTPPPDSSSMAGTPATSETTPPAASSAGTSLFDPTPATPSSSAATVPGAKTTVALTRPIEIQLTYGKIKVPAGTQLKLIAQDGLNLTVRFQNQTVSIPASATDIAGDAPPSPP